MENALLGHLPLQAPSLDRGLGAEPRRPGLLGLEDDDVALCGPVITELRRGFKSAAERSKTIALIAHAGIGLQLVDF